MLISYFLYCFLYFQVGIGVEKVSDLAGVRAPILTKGFLLKIHIRI